MSIDILLIETMCIFHLSHSFLNVCFLILFEYLRTLFISMNIFIICFIYYLLLVYLYVYYRQL